MDNVTVGIIGLGEAGRRFGSYLAGVADVVGFDLYPPTEPLPFLTVTEASACVANAGLVFAFTPAIAAESALASVAKACRPSTIYVDFSTSSPAAKVRLAALATADGLGFAEASIMSPVARPAETIPLLLAGPGGRHVTEMLAAWGLAASYVSGPVGSAAARKLVRSIAVKGLTAAFIEALRAAESYDLLDWFLAHIDDIADEFSPAVLRRYLSGTLGHSVRRVEEMEAAAAMIEDRGGTAPVSRAAVEVLRSVPAAGIPGFGRFGATPVNPERVAPDGR